MSIEALNWALGHMQRDDIESSTAFVLMILANRADPEGVCWPSVKYICARTKLADSTVRSACKRIRDLGLLEIEQQERGDGGKGTNRYKLCITTPPPPAIGGTPPPATGDGPRLQSAGVPPAIGDKTKALDPPSFTGKGARAPKKFPIPDGFIVSDEVRKWAEEHGLLASYVGQQVEAFRDDARANRRLHADWDAALKNWLRRQPNYDRSAPRPVKGARSAQTVDKRCAWPNRSSVNRCTVTEGTIFITGQVYLCQNHERLHWRLEREGGSTSEKREALDKLEREKVAA